jgi:hypothetical protein
LGVAHEYTSIIALRLRRERRRAPAHDFKPRANDRRRSCSKRSRPVRARRAPRRRRCDRRLGDARGHVYKREKDGDGFAIDGRFDGTPWRLEWGRPQRRYIEGHELRLRMVLGLPPDLQMLLMTKPLRERLANDAFEQATQSNQTAVNDVAGEETRWLVVFPKISLAGSQILRNCFAGVVQPAARGPRLARRAARARASSAPRRAGCSPSRRSCS